MQVVVGPGDDCAVVRTGSGDQVLLTVDQLVEGRHFASGTPVDRIARKIMARSVSDIAAMGGTPNWALATGALPAEYEKADALFDSMARWANHWGCPLVGGDIAIFEPAGNVVVDGEPAAQGAMVLTVTVGGSPHVRRGPVLRSGARAGDALWVTGRLGGSLASGRHLTFEPRVREGTWLCDRLGEHLHAMIDLSDGLGIDAGRVAAASGTRVEIDAYRLPMHEGVNDRLAAMGDGEDYELCFTTTGTIELPGTCEETGTLLTRIGCVKAGGGCVAVDEKGTAIDVSRLGWDHGAQQTGRTEREAGANEG